MARTRQISLAHQARLRFDKLLALGQSRHKAKEQHRSACQARGAKPDWPFSSGHIHSVATADTYRHHIIHYTQHARTRGVRTIAEWDRRADEIASGYLLRELDAGKSAWTLKAARSAIRMFHRAGLVAMGVAPTLAAIAAREIAQHVPIPQRRRAAITRSRKPVAFDAHFSAEIRADLVAFCRACGPRRHELRALTVGDVRAEGNHLYVHVAHGKGGKPRDIRVLTGHEPAILQVIAGRDASELLFAHVPQAMDVHSYRRAYAQAAYLQEAAPPHKRLPNPRSKRLFWSENGHQDYDRPAAERVSEWLGHNRVSVMLYSYVR